MTEEQQKRWIENMADSMRKQDELDYGLTCESEVRRESGRHEIPNGAIPFRVGFAKVEDIRIEDLQKDNPTNEGIDVKPSKDGKPGSVVSYNPSHNDGVDSSLANNPTQSSVGVSVDKVNPNSIRVYAIMQRVGLTSAAFGNDGNPLLYALKNERGYRFASDEDADAIRGDIRRILDKFVDQYFSSIEGDVATVMIPSGNSLNDTFAGWFQDAVERRGKKTKLFKGILYKVSTELVRDEVLDRGDSEFYQWIGKMPKDKALKIRQELESYLDDMDAKHEGTFSYHYVKNAKIRNHMSLSMKLSETPSTAKEFGDINECHVLLLDDSVSRGASMREAYTILTQSYHPKSITGLALFSPVKKMGRK